MATTKKQPVKPPRRVHTAMKSGGRPVLGSGQVEYDDLFTGFYNRTDGPRLLAPQYSPGNLFKFWEESDVLQACVACYVSNIDGYGHEIVPVDGTEADLPPEARGEKRSLTDFFAQPNDRESFVSLRKKLRMDFEVTGNAYLEVVRDKTNRPSLLFWCDAKRVRLGAMSDSVNVPVMLHRGGQTVTVDMPKRFRRFGMLAGNNPEDIRYFKEYGDPRPMDAVSGKFLAPGDVPEVPATEILHFKQGNGAYGIPRWIGAVLKVMGLAKADFVNFDLFDNQGIPPMIVTVAGGSLTDESFEDLLELFKRAKGVQNFHKLLVLEAEGTVAHDGRERAPSLEVKSMAEARKEDAMFLAYGKDSREAIRELGFRIPVIMLGSAENVNKASAYVIRTTTEEQVFAPERGSFDETINATLARDLGGKLYKFRSKGPVIRAMEEVTQLLPTAIQGGAFTTNELIAFCNEHFGTKLKQYDSPGDEWANLPIPAVLDRYGDMPFHALREVEAIAKRMIG